MSDMTPDEIATMLRGYKFRFVDEMELHDGIAMALRDHGIRHQREFRLTGHGRLDFFLTDEAIALEVKIKGRAANVLRQLERYAANAAISGLVLCTTRRLHAHQMPASINGKSLATALVGGGL
jgi:hypothetical protein